MNTSAISAGGGQSLYHRVRRTTRVVAVLLCVVGWNAVADPEKDDRSLKLPKELQVPGGNNLSLSVHAVGVQVYVATNSLADPTRFVWILKSPEAVLSDTNGRVVGTHYVGPTWKTESGGLVVGARVAGATLEAKSIPWLLLRATSTEGSGVLRETTYIQRLNTTGGLAPATPPAQVGQEARVPYTADYLFFRKSGD